LVVRLALGGRMTNPELVAPRFVPRLPEPASSLYALLASRPSMHPAQRIEETPISGDPPNPIDCGGNDVPKRNSCQRIQW
jgi:hypothetical protein